MRFGLNTLIYWVMGLGLALSLGACKGSQDDKSAIVAIWHIRSINVNGMEIGDGKGFLDFKADGTVRSRTGPGMYDEGKYTLNPDTKVLTLKQDSSQLDYQYSLSNDSLSMRSNEGGRALLLTGVKVDKLPVDPENDPLPEGFR